MRPFIIYDITDYKLANKFLNSLIVPALITSIGNGFHSFSAVGNKKFVNICSSSWLQKSIVMSCHAKSGPPILVPPGRNIWTPRIVYFNFVEILDPSEQNFLIYLGPFEIFYPPLNLHSTHCVKGDNLFHL